jgi:hypothetical protein
VIGTTRRALFVTTAVVAMAVSACGSAREPRTTPSTTAPTMTATAPGGEESPAPIVTSTRVPTAPTATPAASGETGITGIATIGPTCPVERIDSPCPDRPYEARITIWQGSTLTAETRSGADGHFTVLVPAGEYRVVGESGATFPRGTETTVSVVEGALSTVALRFDSGIR